MANPLPPPRRSVKKEVPRIADFWVTCTNCGKKQLVGSGFTGARLCINTDYAAEVLERMHWKYDPILCPACCE